MPWDPTSAFPAGLPGGRGSGPENRMNNFWNQMGAHRPGDFSGWILRHNSEGVEGPFLVSATC